MERLLIQAQPRTATTKGQLKTLRRQGMVPGVLYGQKEATKAIAVEGKDLHSILNSPAGMNTIIDLTVNGEKTPAILKDLDRDILISDRIIHADFMRISLHDKLEVQVPVVFTGESEGVKAGGILQQTLREVTLKCLPTSIPEHLELDISSLALGESLSVADLQVPEGAEIVTDPAEVIVTVRAPRAEEAAEEAEGETAETAEEEPAATEAEE